MPPRVSPAERDVPLRDHLASDGKALDQPPAPVAQQFPRIPHQLARHLQHEVHGALLDRLDLGEVFADAVQHVVTEQAAAASQPLHRAHRLRVDLGADGVDLLEHVLEPFARQLVAVLDGRRRSVDRRQPDAIRRDRISRRAALAGCRLLRQRHRIVDRLDGQKERVWRRQRLELLGVTPGQRLIARQTPHQLISRLERGGRELRLEQAPEHARVILDEIHSRQQRRPVQLAAEAKLEVVRVSELVEVDRPVQRHPAPARRGPQRDDGRRLALRLAARQIRHALRQAPQLAGGVDAVEGVDELARRLRAHPLARRRDDRRPCFRLANLIGIVRIREQAQHGSIDLGRCQRCCGLGVRRRHGNGSLDGGSPRGDLVGELAASLRRVVGPAQIARCCPESAEHPRQPRIRERLYARNRPAHQGLVGRMLQRVADGVGHLGQVVAPRRREDVHVAAHHAFRAPARSTSLLNHCR